MFANPLFINSRAHNAGWVLLEILGAALFMAVVLTLLQTHNVSQWQSLQDNQARSFEKHKQAELETLQRWLRDSVWLVDITEQEYYSTMDKPICQHCSGDDLKQWFMTRNTIKP